MRFVSSSRAGERSQWAGNPSQHQQDARALITFFSFQSALKNRGLISCPFLVPSSALLGRTEFGNQSSVATFFCRSQECGQRLRRGGGETWAWWVTGLEHCVPCLSSRALNFNHKCVNLIVINFGTWPSEEYAHFMFYLLSVEFLFRMLIDWLLCFWRLSLEYMN